MPSSAVSAGQPLPEGATGRSGSRLWLWRAAWWARPSQTREPKSFWRGWRRPSGTRSTRTLTRGKWKSVWPFFELHTLPLYHKLKEIRFSFGHFLNCTKCVYIITEKKFGSVRSLLKFHTMPLYNNEKKFGSVRSLLKFHTMPLYHNEKKFGSV